MSGYLATKASGSGLNLISPLRTSNRSSNPCSQAAGLQCQIQGYTKRTAALQILLEKLLTHKQDEANLQTKQNKIPHCTLSSTSWTFERIQHEIEADPQRLQKLQQAPHQFQVGHTTGEDLL